MRLLIRLLQGDGKGAAAPETNPAFCQPPRPKPRRKLRYADYIEFSNYAELKKFEKMDKISEDDVRGCDADDLMRRLMDGDKKP